MHEHVHEELAARSQPSSHARKEVRPIPHVFEHFHRHHPIELPGADLERVHVAGHHLNPVLQATLFRPSLDVRPLRAVETAVIRLSG